MTDNYLEKVESYIVSPTSNGQLIWLCIDYNPTTWGQGVQDGYILNEIRAKVHRMPNGSWKWLVPIPAVGCMLVGTEPSRVLAMAQAETMIKELKEQLWKRPRGTYSWEPIGDYVPHARYPKGAHWGIKKAGEGGLVVASPAWLKG